MKCWLTMTAVVLMLGLSALAEQIVTADISETNHGGWGTILNIGADTGDLMTVDITCDHSDPFGHGMCLTGVPIVQTCTDFSGQKYFPDGVQLVQNHQPPSSCSSPVAFQLVFNSFQHQTYKASSPSTGDQFVETQYWWVGTQVHYWLHITNLETIH